MPDNALALQLLQQAVAADPKGKAGVARRLGPRCGRALLSRVLSPNDPLEITEHLAGKVLETYHVIQCCPATGGEQPRSECMRIAGGKAPMHNPGAMRIWRTCQTCAHNPTAMGGNDASRQ